MCQGKCKCKDKTKLSTQDIDNLLAIATISSGRVTMEVWADKILPMKLKLKRMRRELTRG